MNFDDFAKHQHLIIINFLCLVGFMLHFSYLLYFSYIKLYIVSYINIVSCSIYISCFFINRKGKNKYIADILSMEIIIYSGILSYLIGSSAFSIGFIIIALMPHFLFLKSSLNKRLTYSFICYLAFNLIYVRYNTVLYADYISKEFELLNMETAFLTIILELNLSSFIEKILKKSYQENLNIAKMDSYIDPLTKLYNRRYLENYEKELKIELKKGINICIAIMDIDYFKKLNDNYGHSFGDKVLVFLSNKMLNNFRDYDTVIRYGGEEFLIVFKNADMTQAQNNIERFRQSFSESPITNGTEDIYVTFTAGICQYQSNSSLDKCIQIADERLYYGKRNGKNQVVVNSTPV